MQKTFWRLAVAIFVAAAPRIMVAADAPASPAPPAAPSLSEVLSSSGIAVSGYLAASYYTSDGYPANIHQFDVDHDTFQLDQANLTVAYQPKSGFGALVDVIAGEDAKLLHVAEDGQADTVDVKQAFIQYVTGPVTVIAGKFVTLAGNEVIAPTGNTNFSRSLLFTLNEPLTHTGIRATWAASDTLSLIAGVNDGWNSTSVDYGSKTGEVGLAWTPNKVFALTAQSYFGKLEQYDAPRTLVDVVGTYNASSALSLVLNFDWDKQEFPTGPSDTWRGVAGYINYAISDQWRVSLRLEYEDDTDGFLTGIRGEKLKEGTLTFGYAPTKSFELRIEGRIDKSGDNVLYKNLDSYPDGSPNASSLGEFALQGVYKFPNM